MPTIRITATTGIGIIKQIAVEVIIWPPISDWRAKLFVLKMIFKLWTGRAAHARWDAADRGEYRQAAGVAASNAGCGGKADIDWECRDVCFWPKADMPGFEVFAAEVDGTVLSVAAAYSQ
jgi:hypothetical protein